MSTRKSFFSNLAAARRLGGRKWRLRDFKGDDSWQMHRSRWPLVPFEDLDWIAGWCSSNTLSFCLLCRAQLSEVRRVRAAWYLAPGRRETVSFAFTLPRLLSHFCSFAWEHTRQRPSWWTGHRDHVSSHGNCGSAHCSRKVMHFSRFILLLYRSPALTWHDPQLIWIPETPKPALYSFLCVLCSFFSFCGAATGWRSFIRLAYPLGRQKKKKNLQCWL